MKTTIFIFLFLTSASYNLTWGQESLLPISINLIGCDHGHICCQVGCSCCPENPIKIIKKYPKAYVNYDFFEKVSKEAKQHRESRLISFNDFIKKSKEKNTIILDTRSKKMYDKMHIKGAIHLTFADFTQQELARLIPDKNTQILIYCNNNFKQEPVFLERFPTKGVALNIKRKFPVLKKVPNNIKSITPKTKLTPSSEKLNPETFNKKSVKTLALNIPTYINLFGYGYKNVFELDELISSKNKKLVLEGTDVKR